MYCAAIYRVSTEKQVRREGDESIPVQRTAVRAFIAEHEGWTLINEYAEEGVSGFKLSADDRDVLQQAYRDAKAGLWQALIVYKADRLSRNAFEYPVVIDRFRRAGCEIWSVKDGVGGKLLALDTQMDKFVRFLEGWQAETESMNTSIRVSEAMLQLARQGRWSGGPAPYGFHLNAQRRPRSDTPALVIDPEQAEVINLMVDLYLDERMGCIQIAGELNRRAVPNPAGRPWDDQKVRRLLQNPIIAGLPAYNRSRPCGKHFTRQNPYDLARFILPRDEEGRLRPNPAYQIVPLDRWLRLLGAMQTARPTPRETTVRHTVTARVRSTDALLTGLLFCGHCGARLSASASAAAATQARGRRLYYICQTQVHRGRQFCDGQRTYGCKRLERVVTSQLERLVSLLDPAELGRLLLCGADADRDHRAARARAAQAEAQKADRILHGWLTRMDSFLASPEASTYSEELLSAKIREARQRQAQADVALRQSLAERDRSAAPPPVPGAAPGWWQCFSDAPPAEQKLMLRDLVARIDVRRDEVEIRLRVDLSSFQARGTPRYGAT